MKIIQSLLKSYILDKNAYIELRETNFFLLIMLYMISRIPYFLVFRIYEEISIQILGKKFIFDFLLILFRILLLIIFNQLFIKKYDNKSIASRIVRNFFEKSHANQAAFCSLSHSIFCSRRVSALM